MGLEAILNLLGVKKPFKKDGSLTIAGEKAMEKISEFVDNLEYIGAFGKTGDELMNYLDEIVRVD